MKVGDKVIGVDFSIHRFKDTGLVEGKVYTVIAVHEYLSLIQVDSSMTWHDIRRFIPATDLTIELA